MRSERVAQAQWCERGGARAPEWLRLRKRTGPISSAAPTRQGQRFGGLLPLAAAINVKILLSISILSFMQSYPERPVLLGL